LGKREKRWSERLCEVEWRDERREEKRILMSLLLYPS
jgi:hypothetical protein